MTGSPASKKRLTKSNCCLALNSSIISFTHVYIKEILIMQNEFLFTSESVSEGHPDKIADQISDAILDAMIEKDKCSRVACETLVKTGMVLVAGEVTTSAWVDVDRIAREVVREIGYDSSEMGFDWASCAVMSAIGKQSLDIAQGVDREKNEDQGAGD